MVFVRKWIWRFRPEFEHFQSRQPLHHLHIQKSLLNFPICLPVFISRSSRLEQHLLIIHNDFHIRLSGSKSYQYFAFLLNILTGFIKEVVSWSQSRLWAVMVIHVCSTIVAIGRLPTKLAWTKIISLRDDFVFSFFCFRLVVLPWINCFIICGGSWGWIQYFDAV